MPGFTTGDLGGCCCVRACLFQCGPAVTIETPEQMGAFAGGQFALARAIVGPGGTIVGFELLQGGGPYPGVPWVTVTPPQVGPGLAATAHAVMTPDGLAVDHLVLDNPGSGGYLDNTPPAYLNFSMSCPSWTFSFPLPQDGPVEPTDQAGTPVGMVPWCTYTANQLVSIPGSSVQPPLNNLPLTVTAWWDVAYGGYILTLDFAGLWWDLDQPWPCAGILGLTYGTDNLAVLVATQPTNGLPTGIDNQGGPYGPIELASCAARPWAMVQVINLYPALAGVIGPPTPWYVLAGGDCPGQALPPYYSANQPAIPLTVTLSEP